MQHQPNVHSGRFGAHEMSQGLRLAGLRGAETRKQIPLSQLLEQFRDPWTVLHQHEKYSDMGRGDGYPRWSK